MKKFRYRLERVLHFRELVKGEKHRELVVCQQALRASEERLQALGEAELALGLADGAVVRVEDIALNAAYATWLQAEIVNTRLRIVEQQEQVEVARLAYIEAAKEQKTLATHREQKLNEYRDAVLKNDEKTLDELATQRHHTEVRSR